MVGDRINARMARPVMHSRKATATMFKQLVGLSLLALLVVGTDADSHRKPRQISTVTRTVTSTSTSFATVTSKTSTVCAKYINATSACRRKRQFWIDTPVILALDEEMEPLAQQFLNPSPVFNVQPTQQATLKQGDHSEQVNVGPIQSSVGLRPEMLNHYMFREGVMPFHPPRPYRPIYNYPYNVSPYGFLPEGRLGAVGLLNLFAQILGVAATTTTTVTTTVPGTTTSFVTNTGTVVISGCSPPGLTYATCA